MKAKKIWMAACAAAVSLCGVVAHANTITLDVTGSSPSGMITTSFPNAPSAGGGLFDYTYNAHLTGDASVVNPGAYFVIYDFNGFAGFDTPNQLTHVYNTGDSDGDGLQESWTATLTFVGPDPVGDGSPTGVGIINSPSTDSAGRFNLLFTYSGADPLITAPIANLGSFRVLSGQGVSKSGLYGSQDFSGDGPPTGLLQGIVQSVRTPSNLGPPDFTPTPAAACGGAMLLSLLGIGRRRSK